MCAKTVQRRRRLGKLCGSSLKVKHRVYPVTQQFRSEIRTQEKQKHVSSINWAAHDHNSLIHNGQNLQRIQMSSNWGSEKRSECRVSLQRDSIHLQQGMKPAVSPMAWMDLDHLELSEGMSSLKRHTCCESIYLDPPEAKFLGTECRLTVAWGWGGGAVGGGGGDR